MSVTDTTSGQNVSSRSRTQRIFLPALGGGSPRVDVVGDTWTSGGTFSVVANTNGIMGKYQCAASIGATAGFTGDAQYCRALDIQSFVQFKFNHITNTRIFIGLSDQSIFTMTNSDSPPGNYFGLWFSDAFDPNNIYAISKDGTTFKRISITTVDTVYHRLFLRLFSDGGAAEVQLQVDDNTMNGITSPGIVPNSTLLKFVAGMITKDGGAKSLQLGKIQVEQAA